MNQEIRICIYKLCELVTVISATPWTVACKVPLSLEFSRQEYCSGLPCFPPGIFLIQGSTLHLPTPALQVDSLPLSHQGRLWQPHLTSIVANQKPQKKLPFYINLSQRKGRWVLVRDCSYFCLLGEWKFLSRKGSGGKKIAVLDSETETSTEHKVEGDSKSELNFSSWKNIRDGLGRV